MSVRVVRDTGGHGVKALQKRLRQMKKRVLVGVPAGKTEPDGTSTAKIAAIHEFGAPERNIPERSFLRSGIRENLPVLTELSKGLLPRVVEGVMGEEHALGILGTVAASKVQDKIVSGPFTPNAPRTVARKGSDKPLIDTGSLRQSITYVVESGGKP